MICCVCGELYKPEERDHKFFQVADMQEIELINIEHLENKGKILALCDRCTRAAAFGKLEVATKNTRFKYYRPQLRAAMYEEDQLEAS